MNFVSLFPIDCKAEYFLSCFQTLPEGGLLHSFKQSQGVTYGGNGKGILHTIGNQQPTTAGTAR